MSKEQHTSSEQSYLSSAYTYIHITLFLPVLLLPLSTLMIDSPILEDKLFSAWVLVIAIQLMVTVSMDSMLYRISNFKQTINAFLWVSLFTLLVISTVQEHKSAWLLGILFLIHSLRAASRLIKAEKASHQWWLWFAWKRDILAACIALYYHSF